MIAFFCTMPMSRMMPISAMTLRSVVEKHQRQQRARAPADGSVERIVIG
jgi:hypothetical protein